MSKQSDQDWVDYQHGLQGTLTGSLHNQMGYADGKSRSSHSSSSSAVSSQAGYRSGAGRDKTRDRAETKSSSGSFSYLLAIVVFAIVAITVYQPVLANGVVAIICGIGAGLIAGKLWKAILAIVGILGALYVAGLFIGG